MCLAEFDTSSMSEITSGNRSLQFRGRSGSPSKSKYSSSTPSLLAKAFIAELSWVNRRELTATQTHDAKRKSSNLLARKLELNTTSPLKPSAEKARPSGEK
jgi:hypothetical protein